MNQPIILDTSSACELVGRRPKELSLLVTGIEALISPGQLGEFCLLGYVSPEELEFWIIIQSLLNLSCLSSLELVSYLFGLGLYMGLYIDWSNISLENESAMLSRISFIKSFTDGTFFFRNYVRSLLNLYALAMNVSDNQLVACFYSSNSPRTNNPITIM